MQMTCAMQPAVLVGIVITTPAHNGFAIQIVLSKYEDNTNKDHKEINLMVKLEQPVVMKHFISLEQFLELKTTKPIHSLTEQVLISDCPGYLPGVLCCVRSSACVTHHSQ